MIVMQTIITMAGRICLEHWSKSLILSLVDDEGGVASRPAPTR